MRHYYAIVYAYGRGVVNNGNRADRVFQFDSLAERVEFLDGHERAGVDADPVKASHPKVKRALCHAAQGGQWPQAV